MTRQNTTDTATIEPTRTPRGILSRLRPIIIVALTVALLSQTALVTSADRGGFITGPDRTRSEEATPLATLNLPTGDVLDFVEVRDDREAIIGFLVFSMIHRDSAGYQSIERLQGANALEVFNALTERGTEIPREMVQLHGRARLGPQGWGIPLLLAADPGHTRSAVCNGTATHQYQGATSQWPSTYQHTFETITGPKAQPSHWHKGVIDGWGFSTYDLYGSASRVTSFSTAVAHCSVDSWWSHYNEANPVLNWVHVRYRQTGNPAWGLYKQGQITQGHYLVAAELKLANHNMPSAMEFDFKLEVKAVEENTLMRVGAAWNKKINDIVLGQ